MICLAPGKIAALYGQANGNKEKSALLPESDRFLSNEEAKNTHAVRQSCRKRFGTKRI